MELGPGVSRDRFGLQPPADRIVLIGGGRNAVNLLGLLEETGVGIAAILDDYPGSPIFGHPVSAIDSYDGTCRAAIMTLTDPDVRRDLEDRASLRDMIWTSYLDRRAIISPHAQIGAGSFFAPLAGCSGVIVGRHATVMSGVTIGPRARIGAFARLLPNATIGSDVIIGEGTVIGSGAAIEAEVVIGANCVIAPHTVVRRDIPSRSVVASRTSLRVFTRTDSSRG